MTSLRVFVDLTVQILNPSVGFPQLSTGMDLFESWTVQLLRYVLDPV